MLRRALRLLLRIIGWLLTPVVLIITAGVGALLGTLAAGHVPPTTGLGLTIALGFIGATIGLVFWNRLLRSSPRLQHVLAVDDEGLPTAEGIAEVLHPAPEHDAGPDVEPS